MTTTDRPRLPQDDEEISMPFGLYVRLQEALCAATAAGMAGRARGFGDEAAERWATACDLTADQLKEGAAQRLLENVTLPLVKSGEGSLWKEACKTFAFYVEVIALENIRPDNPGAAVPPGWQPDGRRPPAVW